MKPFPPEDDPRAFRHALGRFATGVTVVTVGAEEGPVGITANSFASVSIDPPLVLWSPDRGSARYPYFSEAEHYAIHILGAHQQEVCDGFTRDRSAFGGLEWEESAYGVPLIADCLARFECRREAAYPAGDHDIIVGRVLHSAYRDGLPLLFQGGRFVSMKG